jgi:predicted RNA methylase
MFHSEFFPTPLSAIELMQLDCTGKVILEPHAGKGDIVDYCYLNGAKEVLAFEINKDLQQIVKQKANLLGDDFFECKPEQISHIHAIYMNPPFSNADRHILHAWAIAPEGCEIVALCNYQTIANDGRYGQLSKLIHTYGTAENIGECFSTAERTTGIDIGLLRLFKPVVSKEFEFEGFFIDEDEEETQCDGIMQYNEVGALVNRYVGTMKIFDKMKTEIDSVNMMIGQIGMSNINLAIGHEKDVTTKEQFSKIIQKRSWNHIFHKMNMEKYVTSGVMKDINKFVETQEKVPFTMKNIYRMLQIIVGTRQETFNRALEEAVDNFTRHTHENRFGVEGWKTNSGYMLNKKFICEGIIDTGWGFQVKYDSYNSRKIDDLVKVLCNITGTNYSDIGTLYRFNFDPKKMEKTFDLEPNTWYEWGFFEVKFFKKGTMHVKFKDLNDWYLLNQAYGKLKGFTLPEEYKKEK